MITHTSTSSGCFTYLVNRQFSTFYDFIKLDNTNFIPILCTIMKSHAQLTAKRRTRKILETSQRKFFFHKCELGDAGGRMAKIAYIAGADVEARARSRSVPKIERLSTGSVQGERTWKDWCASKQASKQAW